MIFARYPFIVVNFYYVQDARAGLNFADEDEAVKFKTSVEQMLQRLKKRMSEKKNQHDDK